MRIVSEIALILASVFVALVVITLGLYVAGYPAHAVLGEWISGSAATRVDLAVSLKNACPLILTGLCAGIAFRSGVINIGGEGQALMGTLGALLMANFILPRVPGLVGISVALLGAAVFGGAWALIAALLDRYRGVPVVLSTILLNFVALKVIEWLMEGPLRDRSTGIPQSRPVPGAFFLPTMEVLPSLHIGIFIAVAVALLTWVLQARTTFGFELRVTGLNPVAARLAGIPVASRQLSVMMLSGAFAGLAGGLQLLGITHVMGISSPGIGYAGVAVALLGRLHPVGIIMAALFFGLLDRGATSVEISRYALPHDMADIVKGIMVLAILVGTALLARARVLPQGRGEMASFAGASSFILWQAATSATPLVLAGYGELIAQRAGVINVGIEGVMLMGAAAGFAAATLSGSGGAGVLAAMAAGIVFAALFAFVAIWCRADQVVAGTALNILAYGASATLYAVQTQYVSDHGIGFHAGAFFERLNMPGNQYGLTYLTLLLGVVLFVVLRFTRLGIIVQALGDSPEACDAAGLRVRWWRTGCVLFAGALAGIAGSFLSIMSVHEFHTNMTDGRGFLVLALVIFGRWSLPGMLVGTLMFGVLEALQYYFSSIAGATDVLPAPLFSLLPYAATLVALGFLTRSSAGPRTLGQAWPVE